MKMDANYILVSEKLYLSDTLYLLQRLYLLNISIFK